MYNRNQETWRQWSQTDKLQNWMRLPFLCQRSCGWNFKRKFGESTRRNMVLRWYVTLLWDVIKKCNHALSLDCTLCVLQVSLDQQCNWLKPTSDSFMVMLSMMESAKCQLNSDFILTSCRCDFMFMISFWNIFRRS